ncbi:MAG: radical SAM protein [Pseudomonadota bacterium]
MEDLKCILKKWQTFLNDKDEKEYLTIFVHIPFCSSKCRYCMYASRVLKDRSQIDDHLIFLDKEMSYFSQLFRKEKISCLYIGGGTPSIMSVDQMKRLFDIIQSNFELDMDEGNMFSIETNPAHLDTDKIDFLTGSFINRVSVGIQSFDRNVMEAERRKNPSGERISYLLGYLMASLKHKRSSVNADLMIGLQKERKEKILMGLNTLSDMDIPRITLYACRKKRTPAEQKRFEKYVVSSIKHIDSRLTKYQLTTDDVAAFSESNIFYHKDISCGFKKWYDPLPSIYNNTLGFGVASNSYIIPLNFCYRRRRDGWHIIADKYYDGVFKRANEARETLSADDILYL